MREGEGDRAASGVVEGRGSEAIRAAPSRFLVGAAFSFEPSASNAPSTTRQAARGPPPPQGRGRIEQAVPDRAAFTLPQTIAVLHAPDPPMVALRVGRHAGSRRLFLIVSFVQPSPAAPCAASGGGGDEKFAVVV